MMVNKPTFEPITQKKPEQSATNAANQPDGADFNNVLTEMKAIKDIGDAEKIVTDAENPAENVSPEEDKLLQAKNNLAEQLKKLGEKDKLVLNPGTIDGLSMLNYLHKSDDIYSMDISSLAKEDIEFFKICAEKGGISLNDINLQAAQIKVALTSAANEISYKSVDISKGLASLIEHAYNTNKPVRLDFQGDSSVILRIDNKGLLSAHFISGNPATEYALKTALPELRHKFETEGIPYKELSYRDNPQQNRKNKDNKGER
jgi:hypothetical protein